MAKIIDIEGIGEVYTAKLEGIGIATTEGLLKKGATPKGRKQIAESADISGTLVLEWVNRADRFRVKGVAEEYSDLLEVAGSTRSPSWRSATPRSSTESWRRPTPRRKSCAGFQARGRSPTGLRRPRSLIGSSRTNQPVRCQPTGPSPPSPLSQFWERGRSHCVWCSILLAVRL